MPAGKHRIRFQRGTLETGVYFYQIRFGEFTGTREITAQLTTRVEGNDPLAPFGPNAADHLRRTSSFTNCPDLLVNSFYDPLTDEGAAFEELIGFHGGLGGKQGHPFVLAPSNLAQPSEPLVGARSIHELFKGWLTDAQGSVEARGSV